MHLALHTYINTITHRKNSDTSTCAGGSWNAKSCWWLIWSANSWGCYAVLTAVCWRKSLWFYTGTSSNAASNKTHKPPLPHHLTHSATVHLPILGIDISTALPDTFLYMQQHAYARVSSHVARSIISRTILLSNVAQTNAKNISASCYSTVCGVHVCLHCRMDTPNT